VEGEFAGTPFAEIAESAIEGVLRRDPELRATVVESDGDVVGVSVYGPVAGSVGTAKLHLIVVSAAARLQGVARRLCDAAVREMAADGARLVVAELADSPGMRAGRALLERCEWREDGRVDDYFADGQALLLLRREP
jgi:ribosomal protein S18 acetylase RimI-like enzyme